MIDPLELGELGNGPKMTQGEREKEQQGKQYHEYVGWHFQYVKSINLVGESI